MKQLVRRLTAMSLVIAMLLCGCGTREVTSKDTEVDDTIRIGVCFDTFTIERWLKDRDVFSSTALNLGAEVNVQNANGDVDKQKEQITRFIDDNYDAIVIIAVDETKLGDEIAAAHKKGIKIVAYDRMINNPNVDLYVSFDNEAVGAMMAESIGDRLNEKSNTRRNVLMICGSDTDRNVGMVETGFERVAEEKNLHIVDKYYAAGWRAENVDIYFAEHPDVLNQVDAIMCGNDSLAGEVISILAVNRKAGDIVVVGQDADLDACQRIVEGTQTMTVYKAVELMASEAAVMTVSLCKNRSYGGAVNYISCDGGEIMYIAMTPEAVTIDNLDQVIIESGFHLKEDVYRNVGL